MVIELFQLTSECATGNVDMDGSNLKGCDGAFGARIQCFNFYVGFTVH